MVLLRIALGKQLRELRHAQGRTLRDVAGAANVALGYLSEIERGHKEPSSELLTSICVALETPLSEVLAGAALNARRVEQAAEVVRPIRSAA